MDAQRLFRTFLPASFAVLCALADAETPSKSPVWLNPYPGANIEAQSASETTFFTPATPGETLAYYRKLFTSFGLSFVPNFDGMGFSLRAAAPECDLLIKIRESDGGTYSKVNCQARVSGGAAAPLYGTDVGIEPSPAPPAEKSSDSPTTTEDKKTDSAGDKVPLAEKSEPKKEQK